MDSDAKGQHHDEGLFMRVTGTDTWPNKPIVQQNS